MNRRLFLGGFIGAPLWSGTPIRVSGYDGSPEYIDPTKYRATLLIFVSVVCPISNAYQDRIRDLLARFSGRPVRVVLVNANDNESAEECRRYAEEVRFPVPVFKDLRNTVADRFGATMTPEAVVLDSRGTVRYQGAIDDSRNPARVKVSAVQLAMDALLADRPVAVKSIRGFGCAIKKVPRS